MRLAFSTCQAKIFGGRNFRNLAFDRENELGPECLTSPCTYPECLNVLTVSNFHQQRHAADKYSVQYTKTMFS